MERTPTRTSLEETTDDASSMRSVRVLDALGQFAQSLPYRLRCSDDLDRGLVWFPRAVALLHHEIAPDPPGWRTALRLDIDCPCEKQTHAKRGYCPRAATYWREANLAEPSFVVVNPRNGHVHYIYLLAGWIRTSGENPAELAAIRYLAAIQRAYTIALRADPGYAGLVHHNPFSARYTTVSGRDEPYSLAQLAAFVKLAEAPRRRAPEIRTDGRNVETFDRLRHWAYAHVGEWRRGSYDDWLDRVNVRAIEIAAEVRSAHPSASHPYNDAEALDTAKSVAGWCWLRYTGADPTLAKAQIAARRSRDRQRAVERRRAAGAVDRETYLSAAQERRTRACGLRAMGLAIDEIARRLGASIRSVYRWINELRSVPRPSTRSDFGRGARRRRLAVIERGVDVDFVETGIGDREPSGGAGGDPVSIADGEDAPSARSAQESGNLEAPPSGWKAYLDRRIRDIIARSRSDLADYPRPPLENRAESPRSGETSPKTLTQ